MIIDTVFILAAFVFGFFARMLKLPPLVGFLIAGFLLHALGYESSELLEGISQLGVTLLLFLVGLKLKPKSLMTPQVWGTALIHMSVSTAFFAAGILVFAAIGLSLFSSLDIQGAALIGFALAFSSTVFAVKILEERGEMNSRAGQVAIGILIIQDLAAVVFLAFSAGYVPTVWALALPVVLFLAVPVMKTLLEKVGHGELLLLLGIFFALVVGYEGFELVKIKGDIGALIIGALLANHKKALELSEALMGFKDLFLVGFFLTIGFAGTPTLSMVAIALLLSILVLFKVAGFFFLLCRFNKTARASFLASLSLANFSEFGLLVASISVANAWIPSEWLVILALSVGITFILASPLNASAHRIYSALAGTLQSHERQCSKPQATEDLRQAKIAVIGMGRIGLAAYDWLSNQYDDRLIGIDFDMSTVEQLQKTGRKVMFGDPVDPYFWEMLAAAGCSDIEMILLCIPQKSANLSMIAQIKATSFSGKLAAVMDHEDQAELLRAAGVDLAFNLYAEAGAGFAEHMSRSYEQRG